MMKTIKTGVLLAGFFWTAVSAAETNASARFEDLGLALKVDPMSINVSTKDARGKVLAFGTVHDKGNNHYDVFVVDLERGTTEWLGLQEKFGLSYIQTMRAANGNVYMFNGKPGNFSKYDANARKLIDLGQPGGGAAEVSYHFGHATGPDGRMYVAGYPSAHAFMCDPATDAIADLGSMTEDPVHQLYAFVSQVDGRNEWLYVPLGLHHMELCAYNLKTKEKRQILPPEFLRLPGSPAVARCVDGNVYGRVDAKMETKLFRCSPDGVEFVEKWPEPEAGIVPQMIEGIKFGEIGADGKLMVTVAEGKTRMIQTPLAGVTYSVYSVDCERDGVIYGGGGNGRTDIFAYDLKSGKLSDLGRGASGRVQIYDLLNHPNGLYVASYPGANLDLFKPQSGELVHIKQLSIDYQQERLQRLTLGPDGMIYTGGVPIKGRLGGAIVRLNPGTHVVTVWRDVVKNQSFTVGIAVPKTKEMFFTTTIRGGTSAVPLEKEAFVILWGCAGEKETWRGQPFEGVTDYGYATMAKTGIIYGLVGSGPRYYAFDPVRRKVVHRGVLPVSSVWYLGLAHEPVGSRGFIYGIGDDAIFAIDPNDHTARIVARHPSLAQGQGLFASTDEILYYGSDTHLWRAILNLEDAR
jgi:hypothetical protein